jgi:hypothetical protein
VTCVPERKAGGVHATVLSVPPVTAGSAERTGEASRMSKALDAPVTLFDVAWSARLAPGCRKVTGPDHRPSTNGPAAEGECAPPAAGMEKRTFGIVE